MSLEDQVQILKKIILLNTNLSDLIESRRNTSIAYYIQIGGEIDVYIHRLLIHIGKHHVYPDSELFQAIVARGVDLRAHEDVLAVYSAMSGNSKVLQYLFDKYPEMRENQKLKDDLLVHASPDHDTVVLLLREGGKLSARPSFLGSMITERICRYGSLDTIKMIVERGISKELADDFQRNMEKPDQHGGDPRKNMNDDYPEIVQFLLEASVIRQTATLLRNLCVHEMTPLKMIEKMLNEGVKVEGYRATINGYYHPLTNAIRANNEEIVRLLLSRDVECKLFSWEHAKQYAITACSYGHLSFLKELIARGAPYDSETLNTAILHDQEDCARYLMSLGLKPREILEFRGFDIRITSMIDVPPKNREKYSKIYREEYMTLQQAIDSDDFEIVRKRVEQEHKLSKVSFPYLYNLRHSSEWNAYIRETLGNEKERRNVESLSLVTNNIDDGL